MTDKLTTLLHDRAHATTFAPPDLDEVTRSGERTLRRRRSLTAVGGVAAVAAAVTAVAFVPGPAARDGAEVSGSDGAPASLTWVTGSTLHTAGEEDVDLGVPVHAYVRTSVGYVYADRSGTIHAWRLGESVQVGRADPRGLRLVSDGESDLVGWVQEQGPGATIVVHDQRAGSTVRLDRRSSPGLGPGPVALDAIDAGTVYWRDARGLVALELFPGDTEVLDPDPGEGTAVTDVEDGVFATHLGQGTVVGTSPGEGVTLGGADGSVGTLSPDGRYYSSEGDQQAVFDTRTGEQLVLDLDLGFATGYEWLSASTLAVLAADRPQEDATAQLLECTVPDGSCSTVEADLGTFRELEGKVAFPTGQYAG